MLRENWSFERLSAIHSMVGYIIFPVNTDGTFPNEAARTSADGPIE